LSMPTPFTSRGQQLSENSLLDPRQRPKSPRSSSFKANRSHPLPSAAERFDETDARSHMQITG
jgi:hypothetical protein